MASYLHVTSRNAKGDVTLEMAMKAHWSLKPIVDLLDPEFAVNSAVTLTKFADGSNYTYRLATHEEIADLEGETAVSIG